MGSQPKTFALIAEGRTDRAVIENILIGRFDSDEEEPAVNPVKLGDELGDDSTGGWNRVLDALREGKASSALVHDDYLVIHIDTDVCEEPGFDVSRSAGGRVLEPKELVQSVREKLENLIGKEFCARNAARVFFAIAVDEIECWVLPLLHSDRKRGKTTGCLQAANRKLRQQNLEGLSSRDGKKKFVARYEEVSKPYRKREVLCAHSSHNPSLEVFLSSLDRIDAQ